MSRYGKIDKKIWGDAKFRALSRPQPNAQTLWIYLLTGPHTTSIPGIFVAGEAGLAEAIGWPLRGFRKAFEEILALQMLEVDLSSRVIWIPKAVTYNPPESPNVVKSWRPYWEEIPECDLKLKAFQSLKGFLEGFGKGFPEALAQALCSVRAPPSANQEQELEQEQELKQETTALPSPKPPEDFEMTAEGLSNAWCFYCTRRIRGGPRDLPADMVRDFAELNRHGLSYQVLLQEVLRESRDRGEQFFHFRDRLLKQHKNGKRETTLERVQRLEAERLARGGT